MGRDFRKPTPEELRGGPDSPAWKAYWAEHTEHEVARAKADQEAKTIRDLEERADKRQHCKRLAIRFGAGILAMTTVLGAGKYVTRPGGSVDEYLGRDFSVSRYVAEATNHANPNGSRAVAQTMQDIYEHNDAAIDARAAEFYRLHADQFVDSATKETVKQQLRDAATAEAMLAAMKPYGVKYGISIQLSGGNNAISVDNLRRTALGIVDGYDVVPTSISRLAGYRSLIFTDQKTLDQRGYKNTDGIANSSNNNPQGIMKTEKIYISVDTKAPAKVLFHELGHGLEHSSIWVTDASVNRSWSEQAVDGMKSAFWDTPSSISEYGEQSLAENSAEYMMEVLSGGVTLDPHRVRNFTSPRTQTALNLLAKLEVLPSNGRQLSTGYVDYLLSRQRQHLVPSAGILR